jgi:hypothetical protein
MKTPAGITRSAVPDALRDRAAMHFDASGYLASVEVPGGRLELGPEPGRGHLGFTARAGGYGYAIDERYHDGAVHSTFCSPWHDGVESSEPMEWSRWVARALASLEDLLPARAVRPGPPATAQVR